MFLNVLIRCYYRKYSRYRFLITTMKKKKKKKKERKKETPPPKKNNNLPAGGTPEIHTLRKQVVLSRIFKRMVPVDYSYQSKKQVSGTFSFACPVTALPVSYRRRLTLCTALSTSPPGHPCLPAATCMYVVGLLPTELNVLFVFVLRRQMAITPNYHCLDCISLRKTREKQTNKQKQEKTGKELILSSSLLSFNGLFAP